MHTLQETKNILRQKNEFLENPKNFYKRREKIIEASKNEIFPLFKKDDIKLIAVNQQKDILDKPEQTKFNDFLEQIKEEQKNIDMRLFSKYFPYKRPGRMLQTLYNSKSKADNYSKVSSIYAGNDAKRNKYKRNHQNIGHF